MKIFSPADEGIVYDGVPTRTNLVTTGALSRRGTRRICDTREDAGYLRLDEKTPEPLLQPVIGFQNNMRRIGGRL